MGHFITPAFRCQLNHISHRMFSFNTPTFYHLETPLYTLQKINIIMSFWAGGDFYALSGMRYQHKPWGYYEFGPHGRLTGPMDNQGNPTPLAARTNPRSRVSHNANEPDARLASLVTIDQSVFDSWQARIVDTEGFLDGLSGLQRAETQVAIVRLRSLLVDLRQGIGRRAGVY